MESSRIENGIGRVPEEFRNSSATVEIRKLSILPKKFINEIDFQQIYKGRFIRYFLKKEILINARKFYLKCIWHKL